MIAIIYSFTLCGSTLIRDKWNGTKKIGEQHTEYFEKNFFSFKVGGLAHKTATFYFDLVKIFENTQKKQISKISYKVSIKIFYALNLMREFFEKKNKLEFFFPNINYILMAELSFYLF